MKLFGKNVGFSPSADSDLWCIDSLMCSNAAWLPFAAISAPVNQMSIRWFMNSRSLREPVSCHCLNNRMYSSWTGRNRPSAWDERVLPELTYTFIFHLSECKGKLALYSTQSPSSPQKHDGCRRSWSNPVQPQRSKFMKPLSDFIVELKYVIEMWVWQTLLESEGLWLCLRSRTCFRFQDWTQVTSVKTRVWDYLSVLNSQEELRLACKLLSFRNRL